MILVIYNERQRFLTVIRKDVVVSDASVVQWQNTSFLNEARTYGTAVNVSPLAEFNPALLYKSAGPNWI